MTIEALVAILDKLDEINRALLAIAIEKRLVLVANQVEQLNQLVNKENKLIRIAADLDRSRVDAVNQYLLARGYHPNPRITLGDLAKLIFKQEEKKLLVDAQVKLLDTIAVLKEANAVNMKLIEQSLAFIDYSLDLVLGPDDSPVYEHPAMQTALYKRRGIFDSKA